MGEAGDEMLLLLCACVPSAWEEVGDEMDQVQRPAIITTGEDPTPYFSNHYIIISKYIFEPCLLSR